MEIGLSGQEVPPLSLINRLNDVEQLLETSQYTFSVSNEGSLEAATQQFGSLKNHATINVRDIEKQDASASQEKFDLILIFNNRLLDSNWDSIIKNAVKLLKENGRICILDIDQPQLQLGTILGSLQGPK